MPDATDCPDGSIPNSLDISLEFEGHLLALRLFVVEPGQETPVGFQSSGGVSIPAEKMRLIDEFVVQHQGFCHVLTGVSWAFQAF